MRILIFVAIFFASLATIWHNKSKLNTDIFSLFGVKLGYYEEKIIHNLNTQNNFSILFTNLGDKEKIIALVNDSQLFRDKQEQDFNMNTLSNFSLALMNRESINRLDNDEQGFFQDSIKNLFSSWRGMLQNDFFGLLHDVDINFGARFDIQSGLLKTQNFYLLTYELKQDYDYKQLLDFAMQLKSIDNVHVNASALYSAYAKDTAMKESSCFGIISTILGIAIILFALRNLKTLYILPLVIFSLIFALAATLCVVSSINVLTLVVSTSLIGLILDYPLHFLSANLGMKILPKNIKQVRFTLLVAFCITSLGYLVFLFSPMQFLHEIALFSAFALIGALCSTYFLFPYLIKNEVFASSLIFDRFLDSFIQLCRFIVRYRTLFFVFLVVFVVIVSFKIPHINFHDNIKDYSSPPQNLLNDSILFSKEVHNGITTKFIIVDESQSRILINTLQEKKLVSNVFFISSMFNDINTQERLQQIFKKNSQKQELLQKYESFGLSKDIVQQEFEKIINQQILSSSEICTSLFANKCQYFFIDKKEVIYVSDVKDNLEFRNILDSFHASYSDYMSILNNNFDSIKLNAVILKLVGFVVAFIILVLFIGYRNGFKTICCVLLVSLLSSYCFIAFNLNIDVFAIFGFILGSAVSIEYMLFALSNKLALKEKILGILTASLTSIASFCTLTLSSTYAVFSFGLSVTLFIALATFLASILAVETIK